MGYWDEEAELEEGEAAGGDVDDYTNIDPDVYLSYIDEKIQNVLGHFQKDFEGGVFAHNLGAKYGGYGSFLPMYQRSPPHSSHPIVESQSTLRSSCNLPPEGGSQNTMAAPDGSVIQTSAATVANSMNGPHNLKVLSDQDLERIKSSQIAEKVPERDVPPFIKSENPRDQRKLTVRIKVVPDKGLHRNAAIYSGLGLSSPSSSTGNSPEEGRGAQLNFHESFNESTISILKVLTSPPVSCDLLNSPLRDDLLNLIRSRKELVDRKSAASLKQRSCFIVGSDHNSESVRVVAGKKSRSAQVNENDLQPRLQNEVHYVDRKSSDGETHNSMTCIPLSHVGTDRSFGSVGKALEVGRHPEQHMPVKKRGLKDKVKERVSAREFLKEETLKMTDVQDIIKHQESRRDSLENFGKHGQKGVEKEYLFDQGEDVSVKGNKILSSLSSKHEDKMDNLGGRNIKPSRPQKVESHTRGKSVKLTAKSGAPIELSSGRKNKLKSSQINENSKLESDGTLRSEVEAVVKDKKSVLRDANKVHRIHKDSPDIKLERLDDQATPPEKHVAHKSKNLNYENISGSWDGEDKNSQKYGSVKSGSKVGSVFSQGGTLTGNVPPSNGQMSSTEPAPGSSAVIITTVEWVQCDRCEKWRLLPPGISANQMPETWTCSMLDWLPGMNHCDISQDETTEACNALYHPPVSVPVTQHTLVANANAPEDQLKVETQYYTGPGKKFQSKDISHDEMKSTSLKNMTQPSSEANLVRKPNLKLLKKPIKVTEKCSDSLNGNGHEKPRKKIKRESSSDNYDQGVAIKVKAQGHEKLKKIKRERDSDYDDQGVSKRVKIEGPTDMDDLYSSENNEKPIYTQVSSSGSLPRKATPKEKQPDKKEKGKLQFCVKIRRDPLPDLGNSDLLDVKTNDATRLSTKTRKLEENGDSLLDTKISLKENSGDSGFRSGRNFKSSKPEVRGVSKGGAGDQLKIGNTQATIPTAHKNAKKAQQFKAKVTSGLTFEDITALRRELGSEQFSTAATSSSSKVSGSGRNRGNYQEVKGSPVESVSSSPMRSSNLKKVSPTRMRGVVKDESKFGEFPPERRRKRSSYIDDTFESNQSGISMMKIVGNQSFEIPVPEIHGTDTTGKDMNALSVHAAHRVVSSAAQTTKRSSPSHVDVQGVTRHTSKIRMSHNPDPSQRQKLRVDPSARPKESNKASGSNFEKVPNRVSILSSEKEALQWKQSLADDRQIDQNNGASSHKLGDYSDNPFSDESTIKALTHDDNVAKINYGRRMESEKWADSNSQRQFRYRDCDQSEGRMDALGSDHLRTNRLTPLIQNSEVETVGEIIPTDVGVRSRKLKGCLNNDGTSGSPFQDSKSTEEIQKGDTLSLRPLNTSKGGEGLRILESVPSSAVENSNHDSMKHPESDQSRVQNVNGASHSKEDTTIQSASAALAKAEEYKHFGDFSKESGFECNEAYFKAALMYLLGASLVESSNNESQKGEMNQIQISGSAAKLCESCAQEYEKRQEMAAAALAYKCLEVSYMRIVYFKSLCSRRVWHDLQASLQMIPQSESPSSSASDIDNSNYQIINEKVVHCKGNGSSTGNHIIAPRDHQNFIRLLDFTKDVNSAMEATRKSQNAFEAASKMMVEQSQDNNIITSVKEVIDFGFQDVEVFVRMVQHAIGATNRLGFGGG